MDLRAKTTVYYLVLDFLVFSSLQFTFYNNILAITR